ncbi:ABC transporter ATP-binding protein [Paraburkholderia caballeronis]|uniref:Amino acid/amide ABC transporter ATP-binding protein 1, HAAT family n=1 Tax=Paraburkholderia caballeronis TaxID=416943 RepID=A0A1H7JCG3_9BURK|nr:ABC transporter ATP-binding protein [Paraburkholderia caballeronis]PXW27486.1 amino acid/amide ABC transporter ATP-binding protein 1 (HAAT family) [Paraburkholderia caballeronis]PXX02960.1 amino acid/amide ABC transporter ATP-binding protein 1 (HAAT family) [Paraburkholderia caballeronis]RAK03685.1 amino acid/amide ABC transporter ATP-binding protein 1 (HAAT family) [Paraburkholderia caballeronis]TDV06113.1 amino acid/amide ABC transporter ATP-binding protein 1 (HAAT family) [Paraburkholderi
MNYSASTAQTHSTRATTKHGGAPLTLEARGLGKTFNGFVAVSDVNLHFSGNGVFGIIGPNGAGKTTLFGLLSGFIKPSTGAVSCNGEEISRLEPEAVARLGLIRSFQITSIFGHLTVAENLAMPMQRRDSSGNQFWRVNRALDTYRDEIDETMQRVGIASSWRDQPAADLSYGLKRSLELGVSLAARPRILLLDEPTAGMSTQDIGHIIDLIRDVAAERMVIMVEHNLRVVSDLAREIVVLQQGRVLTVGPYAEVRQNPQVIEAYLGGQREHGHA